MTSTRGRAVAWISVAALVAAALSLIVHLTWAQFEFSLLLMGLGVVLAILGTKE